MEGQSSLRKQAKVKQRILFSRRRILRCPMPSERPAQADLLFLLEEVAPWNLFQAI